MKTLLNSFSKHGFEGLLDPVKERQKGHRLCKGFKRSFLSVPRSIFVECGYTRCLRNYVEEEIFLCDRPESKSHLQRVFVGDRLGPKKKM